MLSLTKNPVHWFKFYLLGYALLSLYVGLNIPLTWDEGTHTLAGFYFSDLARDAFHQLPQSLSPSWFGNYFTAFLAAYPNIAPAFSYPLAHPLISALAFLLLGPSLFTVRLLAALFTVAFLYYVFKLGWVLFNRTVGIAAAVFLSLVPAYLIVGSKALLDVPVAFFMVAAFYYFLKAHKCNQRISLFGKKFDKNLLACTVLAFLASTTKYIGLLFFPVAYGYLLLSSGFDGRQRKRFFLPLAGLCAFLLYVAALLVFATSGALTEPQRDFLVHSVLDQLTFRSGTYNTDYNPPITRLEAWEIYPSVILNSFNLPLFLLSLGGLLLIRRRYLMGGEKRMTRRWLFLLFALLALFVPFLLVRNKEIRFIFSILALLTISAGVMFEWLVKRLQKMGLNPGNRNLFLLALVLLLTLSTAFPDVFQFLPWPENRTVGSFIDHEKEYLALDSIARQLARDLPPGSEIVFGTTSDNFNAPSFGAYLLPYDRKHALKVKAYPLDDFVKHLDRLEGKPLYVLAYDGSWNEVTAIRDYARSNPASFQLRASYTDLGLDASLYEFIQPTGGN